nr:JmjC domain-containing protein [Tanacetum cinerariifolium]
MVALNLINEEWIVLVDQVRANPTLSGELLGTDVSEDTFPVRMVDLMNKRRKAIAKMKAKAKREKPMTPAQQKEFMRTFETTSISAGATIAAGDPILAVTSVSAGSSIPTATPIAAGVSTTAGASGSASEAYVLIIELLDSPPKDTSLPLDPETEEQEATLRKSSKKKSIARRRTLPSAYKPKSDALPFDEDDLEAKFKRYLRQASDDDEPIKPVSLALVSDITTWEIIPTEFGLGEIHVLIRADGIVKRFSTLRELMYWAGRADLMVLYGLVSDKYKTKRATDKKYLLTLDTIQRMLNHGLEIDKDPSGLISQIIEYDGFFYHLGTMGGLIGVFPSDSTKPGREDSKMIMAPPSPDYVLGPKHPPSLDYVPSLEEPEQASLSLDYVTEPEYLEYLVTYDAKAPIKDQTLPDDASPTALSPGYIVDFDPEKDPNEDLEEDPADILLIKEMMLMMSGTTLIKRTNESFDDDDDDDDDVKEDEEEEEHLAPADSSDVPTVDPLPLAEDTEAFETDESAPTPVPSPRYHMAWMFVRPQIPMSDTAEALIAEFAYAPTPPSPPPSPISPISSPLP